MDRSLSYVWKINNKKGASSIKWFDKLVLKEREDQFMNVIIWEDMLETIEKWEKIL